jgi:DNA-binding transcriptional LysR family regulator
MEVDDWLATNPDSTSYRYFTKAFSRKGLRVRPVFYSASMELLRDMAINGKGTALLPRHLVQDSLGRGTLQAINTMSFYRPIWVISRKSEGSSSVDPLATQISSLLARGNVA